MEAVKRREINVAVQTCSSQYEQLYLLLLKAKASPLFPTRTKLHLWWSPRTAIPILEKAAGYAVQLLAETPPPQPFFSAARNQKAAFVAKTRRSHAL